MEKGSEGVRERGRRVARKRELHSTTYIILYNQIFSITVHKERCYTLI